MRYTLMVDNKRDSISTSNPQELAEIIENLAWEYDASLVVVRIAVDKEEEMFS